MGRSPGWHAGDMDFTINVDNGKVKHAGTARYSISDTSGVLTVDTDDRQRLHYSPSWWQAVEDSSE